MENDIKQERIRAVQRFLNGEKPEAIYTSLSRSKAWLYKWVERYASEDPTWSESLSRQPHSAIRTSKEVEEIVTFVRLKLYNRD